MKIQTISSYQNAHLAEGLTVVVDVLRAFTTCCYILKNGAKSIISVSDVDSANKMKRDNPRFISIGERWGLKIPGFDYGNSPAEIKNTDMKGKTVIFTTSAGTQGIGNAVNADKIITGAFVNARAVVDYIRNQRPKVVSFVVTDNRYEDNEDFMYVSYLKSCLEGKPLNFGGIKKHLINHPAAEGFLKNPMTEFSQKDFHLCLDLDRFDFVITAKKRRGKVYLEKLES